ncbi:cell division protein SepF [Galliscardovia ingluviei]|uniref:Cell division protein SepF n=1 Tax=Galliscardovia ingluviei TaxID=1769422 RepID=A0A8J3AMD3_9BIFI|nr:cell division protein SepF [Galliscardovia ingluviei]GGI13008.1 cell division protein SepF [Galliscardovia ingluviei]
MAGFMKNAMSYFALSDIADDDEAPQQREETGKANQSFDNDRTVTPPVQHTPQATTTAKATSASAFKGKLSRITTIHPKTYEEAQQVGRAIRDGVPVVLNLTGVDEKIAYRIVDFSAGVVFGVRGRIERVTPRVFLLSPAQVDIHVEDSDNTDLFNK